jgi:hypothetical protein
VVTTNPGACCRFAPVSAGPGRMRSRCCIWRTFGALFWPRRFRVKWPRVVAGESARDV